MTSEQIEHCDPSGMGRLVAEFPQQVERAVAIGEAAKIKLPITSIRNIVITGLVGSAIGGDLLRAYLADVCAVPIAVSRHYFLPENVDEKTLVIISSYSCNTE